MSTAAIIIIAGICISAFLLVVALLAGSGRAGGLSARMDSLSSARQGGFAGQDDGAALEIAPPSKSNDSTLTLQKRLKYAQWSISPAAFRLISIAISIVAVSIAYTKFNIAIQGMALFSGPIFMGWLLNLFMNRRFKAFDQDYSPFILQLVSLLKTGMNAMGALESGAQGLDENSLVRHEVELMMERLRFGVSEDKSIGAFAEDVYHPEIELFVQALLLSRRVGGTLSDTLERLAKQIRRRQYFRNSANAAVGMQRGSIWFIIAILVFMEMYLYVVYPESITGAINDETGWQVWQAGIFLILLGIFWVRQVTKIKV